MTTNYQELIKQANPGYITNNGDGVNVAVLDSGIDSEHIDFAGSIIRPVGWNINGLITGDTFGHGTHMAGIIGGRSKSEDGILGFAPNSKIYDLKMTVSQFDINIENLVKALNKIIEDNLPIHVLNMSFNIEERDFPLIKPLLKRIYDKGIIMVCAGGDNDDLTDQALLSPASYENVIAVGTIKKENWSSFQVNKFNEKLNVFFVDSNLRSCLSQINTFNNGKIYGEIQGSSPHTAIVSGIIASNVDFSNPNPTARLTDALNCLNSISTDFNDVEQGEILTLYKNK
jgi:subtilisin family serine protease